MSARKSKKPVYTALSITRHSIELASFSPKSFAVEKSISMQTPPGLLDDNGDQILDEVLMKELLGQLFQRFGSKPKQLHLSLPATLLRMVEMQRMSDDELYFALSSEAERYKAFDGTEAAVDFNVLGDSPQGLRAALGAIRSDTLVQYSRILQGFKIKPASINLEQLNVLRGMAGTGVLDSLVQQIGPDAIWGSIFVEPERVRIALWQGNQLLELRETHMDTREFATSTEGSIVVDDLVEEIRRSCKNLSPVIWLTYQMAEPMRQHLSSRLSLPFTPCMAGNTLTLDQPNISLAEIGALMTSTVSFPFEMDLLQGAAKMGTSGGGGPVVADSEGGGQKADLLMKLGIASIAAGFILTAVLFGANEFWAKSQVSQLDSQYQSLQQEVTSLTAKRDIMKAQSDLHENLLTMINNAKIRNRVYVAFTDDLKRKTPDKLWIHTMKLGDRLELAGNALAHQAVIGFARSFDSLPYLSSVMIESIKENFIAGTTLFDFKIGGNVVLNEQLLQDAEAEAGNQT